MQAKISIIVAIYNIEPYLNACVDSLLRSDLSDCEVLLIDDGSTDGSGAICDIYAENNDRIVVHHKLNGGLSDARNFGLANAKGEWVIFVDGDDFVNSEKFNRYLDILRKTDDSVDVIFNDYILNNLWTGKQSETHQIASDATIESVLSSPGTIWNVWRYAYRKSFLTKHNLYFITGYIAEDLDFTIRVFVLFEISIMFVHLPYYTYSYHRDGSITENASLRFLECMTTLVREHFKTINKRNDKTAKLLKRKLLSDYIKHAAKYYQFNKEERAMVRYYYRTKGSPLPFNPILLAGALQFIRRIYHIGR